MHKTTSTDDKRLQNTLKRLGVNTIPGIEEVNIFQDETVIHFTNPKGKALSLCKFGKVVLSAKRPVTYYVSSAKVILASLISHSFACSPSLHCSQHLRCQRTVSEQKYVAQSDLILCA